MSQPVFERFTERARQVVVLSQDEARRLGHPYIGTEHLLLGLLREEEGIAARVLASLGVTLEEVREQVGRIVGRGDEPPTVGQIPFTPRAKKALELSLSEALHLGHNYIGTEHLLLGLTRESTGVGARILLDFGADAGRIRNELLGMLAGGPRSERAAAEPYAPRTPPVAAEVADGLEELRRRKEELIEASEFELAAGVRERERRLAEAARQLEDVWSGSGPPGPPRRRPAWRIQPAAFALGWALFAVAAGLGVLVGWLIWGQ